MLDRAIAALKANEGAALKAFNDEKNKDFRDRDLFVCASACRMEFHRLSKPGTDRHQHQRAEDPADQYRRQRAYDAVAKAAEGEIVTFVYDFPKPGTKASAPKESLEVRVGKQACGVSYFKS